MTRPSPRTATGRPPLRDSAPITAGPPGPEPGTRRTPRHRPIAFPAHQLFEYLLAGALAELSVHIGRSGLLLGAAGAFALLALTARGPLGVARLVGPRLHGVLDIVVALALAAAPLVPALRPDVTGIIVVEVAALAWLRLATLTRYTRAPPRSDGGSVTAEAAAPDPPSSGAPSSGALVARGLGMIAGRSARRLPDAEEKLRAGARQAGRQAAALQRRWRKPTD